MRRFSLFLVSLAAVVALSVGSGTALATEHNEKSCTDSGGVWESVRGHKTCTFQETETGKNENFHCTTTEETGGRGNLGNKTEGPITDEEEENTGSGKCPPGQYK